MSPERFDHLLNLIRPKIEKQYKVCAPIPAEEILEATRQHLVSGDSKQSISYQLKIGKSTMNGIIDESCDAIWESLNEYVKTPITMQDWENIVKDFDEIWNMLHCLRAIDGKHIAMKQSRRSGSLWHNYKGFFSMVLLAICDARSCFSFVDIGEYGSNNDSGIFLNSQMGKLFRESNLNIPPRSKIYESDYEFSHFLVGDEVFPLQDWLLRPFAGSSLVNELRKIFNYRLSKARKVIENTFGILVARWRILQSPIDAVPEKVEKIVLSCITLHNYLRQTDTARYTPFGFIDSENSSRNIGKRAMEGRGQKWYVLKSCNR